jgi:hypothetical protein
MAPTWTLLGLLSYTLRLTTKLPGRKKSGFALCFWAGRKGGSKSAQQNSRESSFQRAPGLLFEEWNCTPGKPRWQSP